VRKVIREILSERGERGEKGDKGDTGDSGIVSVSYP
jgi:hypothetical protein